MSNILNEIVQNKINEVRISRNLITEAELAAETRHQPSPRSFAEALRLESTVAVIAEVKKASPSAGVIRAEFQAAAIAAAYEKNGANAISVLTDEKFFKGSLHDLKTVRNTVKLPLLRKDFLIDPYQLLEARVYGADCVLLILSVLSDGQCRELLAAADEQGLDVLVEIHDQDELDRALLLGCSIVGINNRDLTTFAVNVSTTERLIAAMPNEICVVSESGIKNRADVERVGRVGADCVLVGETLMRQPDVGLSLQDLVGVTKWQR